MSHCNTMSRSLIYEDSMWEREGMLVKTHYFITLVGTRKLACNSIMCVQTLFIHICEDCNETTLAVHFDLLHCA